jgi:hypothetical protein
LAQVLRALIVHSLMAEPFVITTHKVKRALLAINAKKQNNQELVNFV